MMAAVVAEGRSTRERRVLARDVEGRMRLFLAACAALALAGSPHRADAASKKAPRCRTGPAWTCSAAGPCPAPYSRKLLCAVGKVEGVHGELGRTAAETRARAALAEELQAQARSGSAPSPGVAGEARETVVAGTLRGSVILATHRRRGGVWFALAAIDAGAHGR
jgi:hypothetical protein